MASSGMPRPADGGDAWPSLPLDEWRDTCETLQLWTQVVGKIRLATAPMVNHWWQVPLYASPRGFTTTAMPHGRPQPRPRLRRHPRRSRPRAAGRLDRGPGVPRPRDPVLT